MLDLRRAIRFSMQATGFLELECRFLSSRQAKATTKHEQIASIDQAIN